MVRMRQVVFVVPFALESTLRFLRACVGLEGVRVAVISQQPVRALPADVRTRLAGHEVVSDAFDGRELAAATRSIRAAMGGEVHALFGILEQLQVPLAEVREALAIRGMDVETARNFRDKARMKDVLRSNDLPCARHALARGPDEALELAREVGFPLVCKPPDGSGARATFRVEEPSQLESWVRTVPPRPQAPLLLEEFVSGSEHSFDSVSVGGRHVFHSISRYFPSPLEVMETPWIQWCVLLPREVDGDEYDDIRAAGRGALSALGMVTGLTHMEWFRRGDGSIVLSEVAARPPGAQFTSLLSFAHDRDFYRAWSELMAFETFEVPERRYAAGAAYLRGQGEGEVRAIRGLDQAQRELGELVVDVKLPVEGQPGASSYEGEGYVILRSADTAAVEQGLARAVELIRVELA